MFCSFLVWYIKYHIKTQRTLCLTLQVWYNSLLCCSSSSQTRIHTCYGYTLEEKKTMLLHIVSFQNAVNMICFANFDFSLCRIKMLLSLFCWHCFRFIVVTQPASPLTSWDSRARHFLASVNKGESMRYSCLVVTFLCLKNGEREYYLSLSTCTVIYIAYMFT